MCFNEDILNSFGAWLSFCQTVRKDYFCVYQEDVLCKLVIEYVANRLYTSLIVKYKTSSITEFQTSCSQQGNQQDFLMLNQVLLYLILNYNTYGLVLIYVAFSIELSNSSESVSPQDQLICLFTRCWYMNYLLLHVKCLKGYRVNIFRENSLFTISN